MVIGSNFGFFSEVLIPVGTINNMRVFDHNFNENGMGTSASTRMKLNDVNYVSPRFAEDKKTIRRLIEYGAYTVEPDFMSYKALHRYNKGLITPSSIDKIGFTFSRDYFNAKDNTMKYKNGAVSLVPIGAYFLYNINNEYISLNTNLENQVLHTFEHTVYGTDIFQIPYSKTIQDCNTGEIYSEEIPLENEVKNSGEFFERIYSMKKLNVIELCFDFNIPYSKMVKEYLYATDFNPDSEEENTLYSKDYHCTEDGHRRKSILCVYDKTLQLRKKKGIRTTQDITRIEFRIYSRNFHVLTYPDILNRTYTELVEYLIPYIVRYMRKKMNIHFHKLIDIIPDEQYLLRNILIQV